MTITIETKVTDENGNVLNVTSYHVNTDVTTEPVVDASAEPVVDASAAIQALVTSYGAPFGENTTPEEITAFLASITAETLYAFTKDLVTLFGSLDNSYDSATELATLLSIQGDKDALDANFLRTVSSLG